MRFGGGLRRGGRGLAIGLALACAAPVAGRVAWAAGTDATAALDHGIAALPAGWSIRYAKATQTAPDTLVLKQVVISRNGKLLLAIGTLTLHGLHGDGSAAAPLTADRLEAADLTEPGTKGAAIAAVAATGVALAPGDAGSLPAGARAATTLMALTAVRIDHATLTGITAGDGRIGQATVDGLAHGRLARAALDDIALSGGSLRVAGVDAEQVDAGMLVQIFDPSAYAAGAARHPLSQVVGHFAEHGFVLEDGTGTTRVDSIDVTDVQLGQSPEAPVGRNALGLPSSVAAIAITGVSHTPAHPDEPRFRVGSVTLGPWRDGRLDSFRVSDVGFKYPSAGGSLDLKSAFVLGLDARRLLAWLALPDGKRPDVPPAPTLDSVGFDHVSVMSPDGGPVTLDHLGAQVSWQNRLPVGQILTIHHLHVPASLLASKPAMRQAVIAFGRDAVDTDFSVNMGWDPVTHDLHFAPVEIVADGLGRLTLDLTVGNFDLGLMQQGGDAAVGSLIVTTFKSGRLVYEDHSLVGRVLAAVAATQRMSGDALREQLLASLARMKSPLPSVPRLPAVLAAFLKNPGTLTVTAKPAAPVPMAMLGVGAPADTAARLGVGITATAP